MSVFYYDPFTHFERVFDDAFRSGFAQNQLTRANSNENAVQTFRPRMDLHENAEANTVTATFELPGVKKEDVQIETLPEQGRLRISAETKISGEHEKDGYAVRERRYGKFFRTLQLPRGVKEEEIKASMENGVLTVTFPKTTPEQAPKKITVA
ncbi:SHSP domain-containing protein [Mycena chlorophos]|uniref:SHSP domain-containing protein n=1 Tax=Mycena chlorophos TaxID=658473 RepID=A0A8H6T1M2_MYCCL|nr:SHSP domain-containing protein [Mycena chlorophos]